ncbi:hypothetical protein MACJ_002907 [Theileria orientalis]|uniref:Uncharacterized protein n=1 Tax=Theileria orientalis TaxID=68886 RepID=A0A976QVS5_THEOR|nr:hypothetical protein MACJ_002907 [Theileria orientalis]
MKVILALILLIKAVASEEVNTLSQIYIKKQPSTKSKGDGQFKMDFEFEIPNDLELEELETINYFKLLLLPPSSLEFVEQDTEFKPMVSKLTLAEPHPKSATRSAPLSENSEKIDLGKCKTADAQKVLSSLDEEFKKSLGFTVKKDVASEILKLSLIKEVVVEIPIHKYVSKLDKGTYTWSGTFKMRKDVVGETGIKESFDDFVVALGYFGYFINNDDKYCLTHSKTAAAIMFKRFEDLNVKITSCDSFTMTKWDDLVTSPEFMEPKFGAEYEFNSSETKLKLIFKVEVGYNIYDYTNEAFNFVFTIPEELKDDMVLSEDCGSEVKVSIPVESCSYDSEKAGITFAVSKSNILAATQITFEFDASKALQNAARISENHKFIVEIYPHDEEKSVEVDLEKLTAAVKKVASINPECVEPIVEMAKRYKDAKEIKRAPIGKQTSSDVKHEGKYILYSYDVEKAGTNFLMKLYLKNDETLKGKLNLGMHIRNIDNLLEIKEPKRAEPDTEGSSVSNDGVSFEFNKIKISVDFTGNTEVKKDTYFEIPVLFGTTMNLEKIKNPEFFRLQIEELPEKIVSHGVYKEIKVGESVISELDRMYEEGDTTLYVSKFYTSLKTPAIMFKLTTQSESKVTLLFEFSRPKGIARYSHKMHTDFHYKQEVKMNNTHYYKIGMEIIEKPKTKISSTIVLEISPEDKEFSMENLKLSVISANEELGVLGQEKEKVLFTKVVRFVESDFKFFDKSVPCLTKDTKFSSSRFRLLENGTYISARSVDCERPWMPYVDNHDSGFDITVQDNTRVTGFTLKEMISLNDPLQSRVIEKLIARKGFYQNTIYLLFDDTGVNTIKAHMIAADMCKKSDSTCPDKNHLPVLTKFVTSLLEGVDLTFINVMVGYFYGNKLELHVANDKKKIELKDPKRFNGLKNIREALETLLDSAFEKTHSDNIGASFSVLSVLDKEKIAPIKSALREYEVPSDPRTTNGKYPNPVYIEMIPVDETSTFEVKSMGCDTEKKEVVAEAVLKLASSQALDIADFGKPPSVAEEGTVYTGYSFVTHLGDEEAVPSSSPKKHAEKALEHSVAPTLASGPRPPVSDGITPGRLPSDPSPRSSIKRENYSLFFKIRDTLKPMCLKSVKSDDLPLLLELKSVMKTMESIAKSHHIIAACSTFKSDNLTKGAAKYILSFRGVKLGEYSTTPTPDIDDKLYSECDLLSLYKFLSVSAYSVSTD